VYGVHVLQASGKKREKILFGMGFFLYLLRTCKRHVGASAAQSESRLPASRLCLKLTAAACVAMAGSVSSTPALADSLRPFVSAGVEHDDNLFRASSDEATRSAARGDTYRSAGGGVRFERPVSRQLITAFADFSSVKFDRNSQLDYLRKDIRGDWHWFVASRFDGHVGGYYLQELASFADFDVVQRNLRVSKKRYADGRWRFHPSWQLRGEVSKEEYVYELASQRASDRTEDSWVAGFDYLARSGSTAGFQLRRLEGKYPNWLTVGNTGTVLNGYDQDEAKLNVLWLATGSTQVLFLGGWVQRKQMGQSTRDDSGTNARLIVNYTPAGKVKVTGQAWREFAAIDGALIGSALANGASAQLTWELSAKIQAEVDVRHEEREFKPFGGAVEPVAAADLASDSRDTRSVGLVYKPLRNITIKARAFQEQRSGSLAAGTNSYKANGGSINATLQFN
jgi:exopolysaccharide biosynthesis operon protein EpsL